MKTRGRKRPWLTVNELADAAEVEVGVVRTGLQSGLLDAWARLDGGVLKFRPDTVPFIRWSNQLVEKVSTGEIEPIAASEQLWQRARQLRRRVALSA